MFAVQLLFYWQSQFDVLHYSRFRILTKIWKFWMKFVYLILRKIFKFVSTRRQILRLKCTKFDFGWGSAPNPAGRAYSASQTF